MTRWYLQTSTHLSKDGEYYIVPVVYEGIIFNQALAPFFDVSEKLNIDALKANKTFMDSAKIWALEKLANDLAKAIGPLNYAEAPTEGILPADSTITIDEDGKKVPALRAESWHIDPRPPEQQNLFLKIIFSKSWVDSLPPKVNPDVALTTTERKRNVLLEIKTLEKDLSDLQLILKHFDYQILQSRVQPLFDASCAADKVSKILELLNRLLQKNDKPLLNSNSPAAFQFGFTEGLELQYIAYADLPDCLCDEANINAFILKKGVEELKKTPPFDAPTINGLLYYLPEIKRKYAPYLQGAKKQHLFSSQESWVRFVKSYVVPEPKIEFDNDQTSTQWLAANMLKAGELSKDMSSLLKKTLYPGLNPMSVLPADSRKALLGMANAEVKFGGDDIMLKALTSEIYSTTTLFDNLLNKVPVYELIKIAVVAIVKCSGDMGFKKKLCELVINMMTYNEIKTDLYPCLREQGAVGETAINLLEIKMSGRMDTVYKKMEKRYPDKFKGQYDPKTGKLKEGMGSIYEDEAKIAAMNELYCADTYLQKLLGRAPDDFSEEMLEWLEDASGEVICDCILAFYGPAQQILGFVESMKEGVEEIADTFDMNNARAIEQQSTVALDRILAPFYLLIEDGLAGWFLWLLRALQDVLTALILGAIMVVLKHVKSEILGGLMKDICGSELSNPFSRSSLTNMIMNSTLYKDHSWSRLKKTLEKITDLSGYAMEFQAIIKVFTEFEKFTPSELKRLLTTKCNDNSADDLYLIAQAAFVAKNTISQQPGTPTSAALAAMGKNVPTSVEVIPSLDAVHSICLGIGNQIDPILLEKNIEDWEKVKAGVLDLCEPEAMNVFASTLSDEDFIKQTLRNNDDLLDDIGTMMPLLDPNQIADMMPPLFCGPCKPGQVGTKPLMPSQTHPSQLFLVDRLNSSIYKTIDRIFNNNLSVFKPLMSDSRSAQKGFADIFGTEIDGKAFNVTDISAKTPAQMNEFREGLYKSLVQHGAKVAPSGGGPANKLVAKQLLTALESTLGQNVTIDEDIPNFSIFKYDIKGVNDANAIVQTPFTILLILNFSNQTVTKESIVTHQNQIKLVVKNAATQEIVYEWPDPWLDADYEIKDFQIDDVEEALQKYFFDDAPGETYKIIAEITPKTFQDQTPTIINLILETILTQGTSGDMFKSEVFDKIPLTNSEAATKCKPGIGNTPLLNIEQLKEDVSKTQQSLECVISMFDTPDAVQIANLYGLYKLLIKICVVEEYLKNIFMFGFVKVSDLIRTGPYMSLVIDNLTSVVGSTIGQDGSANLLNYAEKIINGREQLKETASTATSLDGIKPIKNQEECLRILILEASKEIENILNSRIQNIVDPSWLEKFQAFDDLDENKVYGRMLSYAILANPEYWSPNLHPHTPAGGVAAETTPTMRLTPELPDAPNLWPVYQTIKEENIAWNGGLFFQPYVKFESTSTSKYDFWMKFNEAASSHVLSSPDSEDPEIINALNKMRNEINIDPAMASGDLLTKFWNLFFQPEVSPAHTPGYSKAPFMRLVSSFNHNSEASLNINSNYYYYWDNEWDGGSATYPWHWAWRGAISTNQLVGTQHTFAKENQFAPMSFFGPTATIDPTTQIITWGNAPDIPFFSAGGSDTNGFLEALGMAKELFPDIYSAEQTTPEGGAWWFNSMVEPWLTPETTSPKGLVKDTADFLTELGVSLTDITLGSADFLGATTFDDNRKCSLFWRKIRDIIFDSDYSKWFTIKVGMRLNVLFPMTDAAKNDLESLQLGAQTSSIINAHNEDKLIRWTGPDGKPYFCLPLDYVEHTYQPNTFSKPLSRVNNHLNTIKNSPAWAYIPKHLLCNDSDTEAECEAKEEVIKQLKLSVGESPSDYSFESSNSPLWAVAKAFGYTFEHNKKDLLGDLKQELSNKVLNPASGVENKVLNELFPIKDILMVAALMYRYHMVGAYPFLDDFLAPTKDTLNRCIAQMIASQEGNYEYIDSFAADLDSSTASPNSGPSPGEIAEKFLLMAVEMGANIVDKTWKTDWFMPGPLTPIGIIAKILLSEDEEDDIDVLTAEETICPETKDLLPTPEALKKLAAAEKAAGVDGGGGGKTGQEAGPPPSLECAGQDGLYWIIKFPRDETNELYKMKEIGGELPGQGFGSAKGPSFKKLLLNAPNPIYVGLTTNNAFPPWSTPPDQSEIYGNTWQNHCNSNFFYNPAIKEGKNVIPLGNGLLDLKQFPQDNIYPHDIPRGDSDGKYISQMEYATGLSTYPGVQLPYSFVLRDRIYFGLTTCVLPEWRERIWRGWLGKWNEPSSATACLVIAVTPSWYSGFAPGNMLKPSGNLIDYLQENSGMEEIVDWYETTPQNYNSDPYPDWDGAGG